MQRRNFGNSKLSVSVISLGCWIFGVDWWGHYTQQRTSELCQYSFDHGVTFFDNGDAYGNGRAETAFGQWLKDSKTPRDKVEIGSKFGYDFYTDPGEVGGHRERKQDFSPAFMRQSLEKSLHRLGTDYIDLYMAHNIKLPQFRDDIFEELDKVQQEGKIRAWGVSLGPAIGWREEGFEALQNHHAKAVQTVFNLFEQNPGHEFCELAVSQHAGVLARVHDNSSILKDVVKVDTTIDEKDHRKFRDAAWKTYGLKKLELVRPIAQKHGMTMHEFACKWLLQQKGLTAITGTFLNEHEIQEAINSVDKPDLTEAELTQLAVDYSRDWNLGDEAHPCELKSSKSATGRTRSNYVPPPVLIA